MAVACALRGDDDIYAVVFRPNCIDLQKNMEQQILSIIRTVVLKINL